VLDVDMRGLQARLRSDVRGEVRFDDGSRGLYSCRTQIAQGTERQALHLAEVMKLALESGEDGPARGTPPERHLVEQRRIDLRRSMIVAAIWVVVAISVFAALVASYALRS
jgi:hypothetical protein